MLSINLTSWMFGKIFAEASYNLIYGPELYKAYCLFWITQMIYHSGEFLFTVCFHVNSTSWDSKILLLSFQASRLFDKS